ncbi:tetratricopeptide repeat protein [Flavobacterium capsici]|uniref:Tetratricopeptide repeat protein n=1 Tax=Flavobacterium capsici TaxID=3075618 RepID=A0AA96EUG7_9FLAO|nr:MULTISPECIES: tetratricopeptide repeat protein [unclassified Flavobacterium]WNM18549.1 tetratricopeptide repeat protein [Flavobacterium sp. PMR2A8]WNM22600.1 tetratricopeptide repeat protein [Flavobacterium sp. PMTSA4]
MKILFSLLLVSAIGFAQNPSGYWDNVRTTNETITLKAGEKKFIKSTDFPEGTTELAFRITLLDDNEKLSSSLVSLLKSIPDPSGISQGTAGALFLATSIKGSDKCKYAVFTNENDAKHYLVKGETKNACLLQETPVNKDAKLFNQKSTCMSSGIKNLWIGFESDNWVMNEKIVLEIVPWVDYKASNGWTNENKKELLSNVQTQSFVKHLDNKDLFLGNFINAFSKKYKYSEYQKLLKVEKLAAIDSVIKQSLKASGQMSSYLGYIREDARMLNFVKKTDEAIAKMQNEIMDTNLATDKDYGLLGNLYIATKQFIKAEQSIKKAIEMNPTEVGYHLKLAHIYMFTDRVSEAKDIHRKYQKNSLGSMKSWKEQTEFDFKQFEENGFDTSNFKKILRVLD